ncbi:amidohydrolase [Nocardioides scoriae]|uniref:amidohydrolase n=1 Tax=Nocardioides scoriae TaxID=642780 RepID=UPI001E555139|nr:amidohydrolase [Nocardioides scoriae]
MTAAPPTAFVHARLFDGRRHRGDAGPVVVQDGRVVAVGGEVPSGARVVDCAGGLLSPGFTDAHVHTVQGGLERVRCDLSEDTSREDYLRTVQAYAAAHRDRPWVLGGGWAMAAFPGGTPLAADLDAVVPDRPVFLPNRDHHGAWVNSRALELAGITRETPDPPDGRFERDAEGHPTGTLHEGAMAAVVRVLPRTTAAEYDAALLEGQSHLHSLGVVGWQDAIVGSYAGMDDPGPAYVRAAERGTLTAHVVGALWWDREQGVEQVGSLVERRAAYTSGRFRATSVKIMQDGVAENFTAALGEPYLDRCGHATSNRGHSFVDAAALAEAVGALDAQGFQVHVHAIGDRGVRETLDAFATLPRTGPARDLRHHVAHLQLVDPADVRRFAELGVAANAQALWACHDDQMDELTIPFLGEERTRWQYPFGDLERAGTRLVMGSDWPVSSPDPLAAIHVAVNRWEHGTDASRPFLPEQAISLESAFAAYTSGSAWVDHRDDAGHLAPGAVADLVLLDRDPFAGEVADVGATRVVATWVDGRLVGGEDPGDA